MKVFQLDENANSEKFVQRCQGRGSVGVKRFPRGKKGAKDEVVIETFLTSRSESPLLTLDLAMPHEHKEQIPESHPGLITIGHSKEVAATVTIKRAERILERFKHEAEWWSSTNCKNSVVEITETHVRILHKHEGDLVEDDYRSYDDPEFSLALKHSLEGNSKRHTG